jgi:hypothetical protein
MGMDKMDAMSKDRVAFSAPNLHNIRKNERFMARHHFMPSKPKTNCKQQHKRPTDHIERMQNDGLS